MFTLKMYGLYHMLQQGLQRSSLGVRDIFNLDLSLCQPCMPCACSPLHPYSLTGLFTQAMLGGVSCSQGHPVLQLSWSVCFSSTCQGICLGWGYGCG